MRSGVKTVAAGRRGWRRPVGERGWRRMAGILALVFVLSLCLGAVASAQSAPGSDPAQPGSGNPGGKWGWRQAQAGGSQGDVADPECRPGQKGRLFLALCRYLDMQPRDLWELGRQHGRARVIMGAPIAKLSGEPLGIILKAREETGSWMKVLNRLDVDPDEYLLELERLLQAGRPGPRAGGQDAGDEGNAPGRPSPPDQTPGASPDDIN